MRVCSEAEMHQVLRRLLRNREGQSLQKRAEEGVQRRSNERMQEGAKTGMQESPLPEVLRHQSSKMRQRA